MPAGTTNAIEDPTRSRRRRMACSTVTAAVVATGVVVLGPAAEAAKADTCRGYSVTVGGQPFTGDQDTVVAAGAVGAVITVVGTYNHFTVDAATFAVRGYTLTGADGPRPDKDLPVDEETVIFESKIPQHDDVLDGPLTIDLSNEGVVLERAGDRQDMKIQAKDCPQGGLSQMEPEPGTTYEHKLGPDFRYNGPAGDGRLCFTNGAFSGYESPELAVRLSPLDGQGIESRWQVSAGGRMGMVIGEDAVEGGCLP